MLRSSKQQQSGPSNESTSISTLRDQQSSSSNGSGSKFGGATNNGNSSNSGGHNNNNRKFWGEEVTDDAIYNVYLKKITYSCHDNSVYDQLPFEKLSTKGTTSNGNGHNGDSSGTNGSGGNNNDGAVGSSSSGSGSLVDGLQRAFFSKDVFRRKSLDKGSNSNKNKRSASTSDMLDYGRVNGINGNGNNQRSSPNHQRRQQQQNADSSATTSMSSSSSLNTSLKDSAIDSLGSDNGKNGGIKMKNYQKILTETFPSRGSPTKLATRTATGTELKLSPSEADPTQSLQWETRQIRILKAATLDHIVQYILHLTRRQQEQELKESVGNGSGSSSHCQSVVMEEERNNVSHVMHVLFIAYRTFSCPRELFQLLHQHSSQTCTSHQQFNFVLIYWLNHYPEDFVTTINKSSNGSNNNVKSSRSKSSSNILNNVTINEPQSLPSSSSSPSSSNESPTINPSADRELKSLPSPSSHKRGEFSSSRRSSSGLNRDRSCSSSRRSSSNHGQGKLVDQLISLPNMDQMIVRKAMAILESSKSNPQFNNEYDTFDTSTTSSPSYAINGTPSKGSSSNILELDARFVAQQLTAIDLEHFLSLKPYSLLEGTRANVLVQSTIKNFNLLSRHVIVTILKANSPEVVTSHWIEISLNLRRMKNFNSLKAVIAGLTNESIYRLKSVVWSKLSRSTLNNFKILSSIVDDVNNQSVLRQTQLDMEGTAKVSLSEESFGTIPYLGTFFTDLTVIDSMYSTFIESKKSGKKLINIEKCSKQFEVITQVQLLQKNIRAALSAHNQSQSSNHVHMNGVSSSPSLSSLISSPSSTNHAVIVPRVARLFRNWFNDSNISALTENDCYKLSQLVEPPTPKKS